MTRPLEVDLDDTTACPLATSCEGHGCTATDDLMVATARTTFGVHCLTLCGPCTAGPVTPLPLLEALTRAGRHAEHLGVDIDVVAAVLDAEQGGAA